MINSLLTYDYYAVRGGYYKLPLLVGRVRSTTQGSSYYSMNDANYPGKVPFNIITEEIYD